MKHITHHQYRILCDHMDVYRFMTEIYEQDWLQRRSANCTAG